MRVVSVISRNCRIGRHLVATFCRLEPSKEITGQIACLINCCFVKSWKIPNLVSIVVCSLHQCWLSTISVECHRACCWFPLCCVKGVPNYNVVENLRGMGIFVCRQLCGSVCALPSNKRMSRPRCCWRGGLRSPGWLCLHQISNLSLPIHSGLVGSKLSPI